MSDDVAGWSIPDWCARWGFCKATFYNLRKRGLAPDVMEFGGLRRISAEADEAWRIRMERMAKKQRPKANADSAAV